MPVLFICKFHKDWIKFNRLCSGQSRIVFLWHSRASNSEVNYRYSSSSEILFCSRLPASSIKIQSKLNRLCSGKRSFRHLKASNCKVNSPIWPEFKLVRDFIQIICKSHKDPNKTKTTTARTKSNLMFVDTHRQVISELLVRSNRNSNFSEILWLSWLPVSLRNIQSKLRSLSAGQYFLHYKSMG